MPSILPLRPRRNAVAYIQVIIGRAFNIPWAVDNAPLPLSSRDDLTQGFPFSTVPECPRSSTIGRSSRAVDRLESSLMTTSLLV
jgi:hypothetical protein